MRAHITAWFKMSDWWTSWGRSQNRVGGRGFKVEFLITNDWACWSLPEMKDLCIAIHYTPGVCHFLWVPVVVHSFMMFIVLNTLSGLEMMPTIVWILDIQSCSVFSHTEHQRLLTLLQEFCRNLFFYVNETSCEVVYHYSQHIHEILFFFVNTQATFLLEELVGSTCLWEETSRCVRNSLFCCRLLSLCTD